MKHSIHHQWSDTCVDQHHCTEEGDLLLRQLQRTQVVGKFEDCGDQITTGCERGNQSEHEKTNKQTNSSTNRITALTFYPETWRLLFRQTSRRRRPCCCLCWRSDSSGPGPPPWSLWDRRQSTDRRHSRLLVAGRNPHPSWAGRSGRSGWECGNLGCVLQTPPRTARHPSVVWHSAATSHPLTEGRRGSDLLDMLLIRSSFPVPITIETFFLNNSHTNVAPVDYERRPCMF